MCAEKVTFVSGFILVLCILLLIPYQAAGQEHQWSNAYGDTDHDYGQGVITDDSGNVIITGDFYGTVDFGGGPLTAVGLYQDIFLAKYDADGNHLWSYRYGDANPDYGYSVGTDGSGNVFITGQFYGTVDFGGGPLTAAFSDIFLAKFDANGNHLWSYKFGGSNIDKGLDVDIDGSGNVVITGRYRNTIDFGGGPISSNGNYDIFLAKFSTNGNHIWSTGFGGSDYDNGKSVSIDGSGDVFVTGLFRSTMYFQSGCSSISSAGGSADIFLAKFDGGSGSCIWRYGYGNIWDDEGKCVSTDGSGDVFLTGEFQGNVNFGGGMITNNGMRDIVIAKYDGGDGTHLWSYGYGDGGEDIGKGVATALSGNVFLTGAFEGTVDFGGGPLTSLGPYQDIFLVEYKGGDGSHLWSRSHGGVDDDWGMDVAVNGTGYVFLTGFFCETASFGGPYFTSKGETDIFLAKYEGVPSGWSGDVYLTSDFVVEPGMTLTVEPGTNVFVALTDAGAGGSNPSKIEIIVEGEIDVNGTQAEPVVFRSVTPTTKGDWVGIFLTSESAGGDFDYCTIKHTEYAIETYVPIALDNCVIDSVDYCGVVVQRGNTTIDNSTISNSDCFGVFLGASTLTISGSAVDDNLSAGVELNGYDTLYAYGSSFSNNDKGMILNNGAVARIDNSCTFEDNDVGISIYQSTNIHVKNSSFEGNTTAIHCNHYGHPLIAGNTITGNGTGVYCYDRSHPTIKENSITYNTTGVYAATNSRPDVGRQGISGNNYIYHHSAHIVNATWGITIMAESNYWGSRRGPKPYKFIGDVDYIPYLTSPPPLTSPADGFAAEDTELPSVFKLSQIVPNPFNPTTQIMYEIPDPGGNVRIAVYNAAGQLVRTLVDEYKKPGYYNAVWDGRDNRGQSVASSIYFVQMIAGNFRETKKAVLLR